MKLRFLRRSSSSRAEPEARETPRFGPTVAVWMVLVAGLNGVLWVTGFKGRALDEAVEQGAARAESRNVGEASDEDIREAIRTQRDTLPFWRALVMIGDFGVAPLALAVRATIVAVVFSALAALVGRPARFETSMVECVRWQGIWVFGLAVHVGLMVAMRNPEVETSMVLLLSPGEHPASAWIMLRQVTPFTILGWLGLAWAGWRRGQTNWLIAILVCVFLATMEAAVLAGGSLVIGAGMRLAIGPE